MFIRFKKKNIFNSLNLLISVGILILQCKSFAGNKTDNFTLDVYGTNKISVSAFKNRYYDKLKLAAELMLSNKILTSGDSYDDIIRSIDNDLSNKVNFSYINLENIKYANDAKTHFTIDVVELNDKKQRLDIFLPQPKLSIKDPNNLIKAWQSYEKLGFVDFIKLQQPLYKKCPAWHCLYGFELPSLKKFLKIFQTAEQNKSQLINVLRNDKDNQKRAAAAYLLAHIKNENELITALLPSIYDPNPLVRNNVMRVLSLICMKDSLCAIPIDKIAPVINFPTVTDRNKSLAIILFKTLDQVEAKYLIKNYGTVLVNLLKLKQPNNHDLAYQILKKISHKQFSQRSYKSWEKWLSKYNAA